MFIKDTINNVLMPLKLIIPQPVIKKIPWLTTNEEIRIANVLGEVRGRCLDIGCGENNLIKKYRERGGEGLGIDVYPWPGVDMVVKDSAKLPFADRHFDTITFVACLNHIPNRVAALKQAKRALKDNGIIIITNLTPLLSKCWHKFAFWDRDQSERGMKYGEVYGFTDKEMRTLLKSAGFKIVKRKRFSWGLNNLYICAKND